MLCPTGRHIVLDDVLGLDSVRQGEISVVSDTKQSDFSVQSLRWPSELIKMADLEAVLADVSYLMAMEKSKSTPAARASKKIVLPEPRLVFFSRFNDFRTNVECVYSDDKQVPFQ